MLIKSLVLKKEFITTVQENVTLEDALEILEGSGFRCVPIVDETGNIFRGNIYKMHIYRHKSQGGDMKLPVTYLLKNATKHIQLDSAFFKVFFSIKDLPYIAVLDEDHHFYGILTHSQLLGMLSQSWNVDEGSYVITIVSSGERGDLLGMAKVINKYTSIASCITLDINRDDSVRRTLITLPAGTSKEKCDQIVAHLDKKGFKVAEIENLSEI